MEKRRFGSLIAILMVAAALLAAGCKHKSAGVPHWFDNYGFFNEGDYSAFLTGKIAELTDENVAFSQQIKEFYDKTGEPFWTDAGFQEERISELLAFIGKSEEHGLSPDVFGYTTITTLIDTIQTGKIEGADSLYSMLSRLEILLTDAFVQYAKDLTYGATDPKEANGGKWLYETVYPGEEFVAQTLQGLDNITEHLNSVQPTDTNYTKLQAELRKFLAMGDTVLPKIPYIVADSAHTAANVHLIGERLRFIGALPADYTPSDELDATLMTAINRFRTLRGIPRSRSLDEETIDMLNQQPGYYIQKLSVNIERLRWKTTHGKGENFVAVNTAAFQLQAKCADTIALDMKICCGKYPTPRRSGPADCSKLLTAVKSESPLLYSEINMVVLNPEWNVPEKILADEYYPKMVRDPSYAAKHHYYFVNLNTKKQVPLESIDWKKVSHKNIPYKMVQSSGKWNALGQIKFNFPNTESVYLHDTDVPSAFKRRVRALSHGCIRLEKPREMADLLLLMNDYDSVKMEQAHIILGDEPETEDGETFIEERLEKEQEYYDSLGADTIFYRPLRPTHLWLEKKMPLFIEYFTCYVDLYGDINYRPDVYEKEGNILYLLKKLEH